MKVLDLFSGIGGFSLGLDRAGFETVAFCEIELFPCKVLAKHWPEVPIYNDVRELTYDRLKSDGITGIDVICGGFPCQDISVAGKQAGIGEGTRSGLWSECARLVGEIRPKYAIFENVTALLSGEQGRWFQRVLFDISEVGYDAEWHCIPASELGAHHHRDRVWIVAYPNGAHGERGRLPSGIQSEHANINSGGATGRTIDNVADTDSGLGNRQKEQIQAGRNPANGSGEDVAHTECVRQQGSREHEQSLFAAAYREGETINAFAGGTPDIWKVESSVGRVADGVPDRTHRLKALGNAVVPQIPELIGRAIMEFENAS